MIEYRLAKEADTIRLGELRWQFKSEEEPLGKEDKEGFITIFSDSLKERFKDDLYCWVATENGLIVAHVYIVVVKKVPKPADLNGTWGYITAVYNTPECRNKGIGSALMEKVKEWGRKQNLEILIVWPSERSVPFYERAGFCGKNDILELSFEQV